jgi:uncharacterized protein
MRCFAALGMTGAYCLLAVPAPATAQQEKPSFDCARALNPIEKAICTDPALAKADRELAAAYAGLTSRLEKPARQDLEADQQQWIVERNGECTNDSRGVATCLGESYKERTAKLGMFAVGEFPLVVTKRLSASGKRGKATWSYDIAWPQFVGTTADYAQLNAKLADAAKKASVEAVPGADTDVGREQEWTYERSFAFDQVGERALLLTVNYDGFSGGAHPYAASECMLVDLGSGKTVPPEGVFAPGDRWLEVLVPLVAADLKHQFEDKPGFDDVLQPDKLSTLLHEPGHWCWKATSLDLSFNQYEVGPYVSGPFDVEIPMDKLKPLLRADGPLRGLR